MADGGTSERPMEKSLPNVYPFQESEREDKRPQGDVGEDEGC